MPELGDISPVEYYLSTGSMKGYSPLESFMPRSVTSQIEEDLQKMGLDPGLSKQVGNYAKSQMRPPALPQGGGIPPLPPNRGFPALPPPGETPELPSGAVENAVSKYGDELWNLQALGYGGRALSKLPWVTRALPWLSPAVKGPWAEGLTAPALAATLAPLYAKYYMNPKVISEVLGQQAMQGRPQGFTANYAMTPVDFFNIRNYANDSVLDHLERKKKTADSTQTQPGPLSETDVIEIIRDLAKRLDLKNVAQTKGENGFRGTLNLMHAALSDALRGKGVVSKTGERIELSPQILSQLFMQALGYGQKPVDVFNTPQQIPLLPQTLASLLKSHSQRIPFSEAK